MKFSQRPPIIAAPRSLADALAYLPAPARRALGDRLRLLVTQLTGDPLISASDAFDVVDAQVGSAADRLWLAHSVLAAEMPTDDDMSEMLVRARLGGTWAALTPLLAGLADASRLRDVEVVRGVVTCDVHTTAESTFLSGIQRVVRETATRWHSDRGVEFVGWVGDLSGFRRLRDEEHQRLFSVGQSVPAHSRTAPVIVPWECTHLWVEVITDLRRTSRLLALTQHSRNQVGVLGFDSIPVTSSATVAQGMTPHFARGLAAARRADRVAMISAAAAEEFRGVMQMGAGRRDRGPDVAAVPLAVEAPSTTDADLSDAAAGLILNGVPMVLVVGSHEPRKNHLAVLHAAEVLWREGLSFNLVLIGAGSWNASEYEQVLDSLVGLRRPIQSIRGLPDRLLWAAYRLAHCTLFPSLNEGFGLPVAESLAAGTPVITSNFGSMRDIVAPNGAPLGGLLIDPRDDNSLVSALRTMMTDRTTYDRLRSEASQRVKRSWDTYADELWSYLVNGVRPASETSDVSETAPKPPGAV